MRLLTTKALYRAFPELDHFSDEQCRTFVNAAKRGIIPRLLRLALQLLAGAVALAMVGWVAVTIAIALVPTGYAQTEQLFLAVGALVMLVAFGSAAIVYLITRDLLLRRRIRWVMNARGSCYECSYGLTGLNIVKTPAPDGTTDAVICPECGTPHKADATIGEVVPDEKGTLRYVPSPDARAEARPSHLGRTLRRLIKPTLYTLAAIILLTLITAGGYEAFLQRQAAAARADLLTPVKLAAEMAAICPDLPSPDDSPRPLPIERAESIAGAMETARVAAFPNETGATTRLDFEFVAPFSTTQVQQGYDAETFARLTLVNITVFSKLIGAGLDRDLDALAAMPPVRPMPVFQPTGTTVATPTFHLSYVPFRSLLSANAARARLAMQGTDPEPFAQALRTQLGLISHISVIPDVGAAVESRYHHSVAIDLAARAVHQHRTRDWIDAIEKALATSPIYVSNTDIDQVSRLLGCHMIAAIFADPTNVRLGGFSPFFRDMAPYFPGTRVGTYAGSIDEFEALRAATPALEVDFFKRPIVLPPRIQRLPVAWLGSRINRWIDHYEGNIAHARALPLFLAIERYLLDNGKLPENLDALTPKYLTAIPIDPFTGKPLLYKRGIAQPAPDPTNPTSPATPIQDDGRSYTIYSAGRNQADDGGAFGIAPYQGLNLNPSTNDTRLITMPPPK
jgi:hypothetical protein